VQDGDMTECNDAETERGEGSMVPTFQ